MRGVRRAPTPPPKRPRSQAQVALGAAPPQQAAAHPLCSSQSQAAPLPLPPGPWPAVHQAVHAHPQAAPLAALSHHEPQFAAQAVQQVEPGQQQAPPQLSGAVPAPASTLHPAHDTKDFPPEDWRLVLDSNDHPSYYENIKNPNWTVPFDPEDDDDE